MLGVGECEGKRAVSRLGIRLYGGGKPGGQNPSEDAKKRETEAIPLPARCTGQESSFLMPSMSWHGTKRSLGGNPGLPGVGWKAGPAPSRILTFLIALSPSSITQRAGKNQWGALPLEAQV